MNFDYEKFIAPYKATLHEELHASKMQFFDYVIPRLVTKNTPLSIVETGCMHTPLEQNAGAMTMVFADLLKNHTGGSITTIDISPEAMGRCKIYTRDFSEHINYVVSDSVSYLKNLPFWVAEEIDLLFLDSYDLNVFDPMPSYIHHLRELLAVYDNLSDEVIIGVDDNFLPGTIVHWNWSDGRTEQFDTGNSTIGKGTLIDRFLLDSNWKKVSNDMVGKSNIFTYTR